jgi:hypothetical protein
MGKEGATSILSVWNARMAELYDIFRGIRKNAASTPVYQANLELDPLRMGKICVGISQATGPNRKLPLLASAGSGKSRISRDEKTGTTLSLV